MPCRPPNARSNAASTAETNSRGGVDRQNVRPCTGAMGCSGQRVSGSSSGGTHAAISASRAATSSAFSTVTSLDGSMETAKSGGGRRSSCSATSRATSSAGRSGREGGSCTRTSAGEHTVTPASAACSTKRV